MPTSPPSGSRRGRLGIALAALLLVAGLATGLAFGLSGESTSPGAHGHTQAHRHSAKHQVAGFKEAHAAKHEASSGSGGNGGSNAVSSTSKPNEALSGESGTESSTTFVGTHGGSEGGAQTPPSTESESGGARKPTPSGHERSPTSGRPVSFSIEGGAIDALAPGASNPLALVIRNPNPVEIYVTAVRAAVSGGGSSCSASENISIVQSDASASTPIAVPPHAAVKLPAQGVSAPSIELRDLPVDQDACANASFSLSYSGSAHS